MKKRIFSIFMFVMVVGLLAGCGGDKGEESNDKKIMTYVKAIDKMIELNYTNTDI